MHMRASVSTARGAHFEPASTTSARIMANNIQPPTLPPLAFPPWHQQYPPPPSNVSTPTPSAPSFAEPPAKRVKLSNGAQPNGAQPEKEQKGHSNFDAFNDVALSAGVDLAREEELIRYTHIQQPPSFKLPPTHSFSDRGTITQSTEEALKDELEDKRKTAARREAERRQEHMENPFLQGHCVRKRMERIVATKEFSADPRHGIRIPMEGLFDLQKADDRSLTGEYIPAQPGQLPPCPKSKAFKVPWKPTNGLLPPVQQSTPAPDGSKIMAAQLKAPSKVAKDVPLAQMFALLSMGCEQHIRGLLEDAYGESRLRQTSSDGVVPPEWADLAYHDSIEPDEVMVQPMSVTNTAWDRPPTTERQRTKAFDRVQDPDAIALARLAQQDRDEEKLRAQRRADRKLRKAKAATDASAPGPDDAPSADDGMPPPDLPRPITKKELQKQQKQDYSEEAATRSANMTAAMQIGGRQYSWMTGGKKNTAAKAPLAAPAASASKSAAASPATPHATLPADTSTEFKFGRWREDGPGGRGVQMRDWVNALERDGSEKKALNQARLRLGSECLPTDLPTGDAAAAGDKKP